MSDAYHYTECGLDDVYLLNGFQFHETPYGPGVSIHDVDGLHRAIVLSLCESQRSLTGNEVRFIRKQLEQTQ